MEEIQNTSGEHVEAAAPNPMISESENDNQQNSGSVPVHVVQSLRGENQQLKENFKILAEHLELLKANQTQKEPDHFSKLSDEDVVTMGDLKKYAQDFQRQQQMSIEELKISQMYPDYAETVRKYLPNVLKEDPDLKNEIENARNPFKMAYRLAKNSSSYLDDHKKAKRNEDAQRMITNSEKTGSLSAVGTASPISEASRWKSMSDDEFRKVMNKNLGNF